jgi:hypothetical protein
METITAKAFASTVEFDSATVTIRHGGWSQFGKTVKRIPVRQITAVQWKDAGFVGGFIQFTLGGGIERQSRFGQRVSDARKDENSVTFSVREQPVFERLRQAVEAAMVAPPAAGSADGAPVDVVGQLERLAALREADAISLTEFEAAKARLLGTL